MRLKLFMLPAIFALVACASVSQFRIEDSLRDIGVPAQKADCIGRDLNDKLSASDMQELADFLDDLRRSDNNAQGLNIVLEMENPEVVAIITAAALSCAFSTN